MNNIVLAAESDCQSHVVVKSVIGDVGKLLVLEG